MKIGVDFIFKDEWFDHTKEGTTVPIQLIIKPYNGITYRYTRVTFKLDEAGTPRIQFAYDIIDSKKFDEMALRRDSRFQEILGLILNTILLEMSEEEPDNENRDNDSKKSDKDTGLHSEGSSVSKE